MPRLIDADALDDVLDEIEGLRAHAAFTDGIMVARRELALAPTIDAEPVRHGRWDKNGRCANCGGHAPYWAMATTYYKSPYCFECGAKMTEVQDVEDNEE